MAIWKWLTNNHLLGKLDKNYFVFFPETNYKLLWKRTYFLTIDGWSKLSFGESSHSVWFVQNFHGHTCNFLLSHGSVWDLSKQHLQTTKDHAKRIQRWAKRSCLSMIGIVFVVQVVELSFGFTAVILTLTSLTDTHSLERIEEAWSKKGMVERRTTNKFFGHYLHGSWDLPSFFPKNTDGQNCVIRKNKKHN